MFLSEEWSAYYGGLPKSEASKARRVLEIVVSPRFWNGMVVALKLTDPLVRVLRLADSEKKPAMGYIYEAMDKAKETIKRSFNGDEKKYGAIFEMIDRRWDKQFHMPLHAAGHFLNPGIFYENVKSIEADGEIVSGLYDCIARLVPSVNEQDLIIRELPYYKEAHGIFGNSFAIRFRTQVSPGKLFLTFFYLIFVKLLL